MNFRNFLNLQKCQKTIECWWISVDKAEAILFGRKELLSADPLDEAMNNFWVTEAADTGVESFVNTIKSYHSGLENKCILDDQIENFEERYRILDKIKSKVKKFSENGQDYNSWISTLTCFMTAIVKVWFL